MKPALLEILGHLALARPVFARQADNHPDHLLFCRRQIFNPFFKNWPFGPKAGDGIMPTIIAEAVVCDKQLDRGKALSYYLT